MCEKEMYIYVVFVEEENHSNSYGKFRREFHVTPIIGDTIFVDEANKESIYCLWKKVGISICLSCLRKCWLDF